jgi:hypothetical protein
VVPQLVNLLALLQQLLAGQVSFPAREIAVSFLASKNVKQNYANFISSNTRKAYPIRDNLKGNFYPDDPKQSRL